jgi:subtilisin family serine protease
MASPTRRLAARRGCRLLSLAPLAVALASGSSAFGIVSDNFATEALFDGIYINDFIGATTFYNLGYTGSRAVIANVEGGHAWNGHESLQHVQTFVHAPGEGPQSGSVDRHATWVAQAIGGRAVPGGQQWEGEVQRGIAHGAQLWSGAIASEYFDGGGSYVGIFGVTATSFQTPYVTMLQTGVNGRTADVINGSWGVGAPSGATYEGVFADYIANATGATLTFSAGNSTSANSVVAPGSAWNNITVGSLQDDTDADPYNRRSFQSSRGPCDYFDPVTQSFVPFVRAAVDLCAPGQSLDLAYYGGATGGNWTGTADGTPDTYSTGVQGTSFASPIVAGGAGLLVDVAYDQFAGNDKARDGRVTKAVLMNSAHKTANWQNGQTNVSGVLQTTQSLDWNVGAGRMDLTKAYEQFTAGTADVSGLGGGTVEAIGWDYGQVSEGAPNDYVIADELVGGTKLAVTLDWFMDAGFDFEGNVPTFESLDNLNLQVWELLDGGGSSLIAQSISQYNNVEHLYFTLPHDGNYMLRVLWTGELFDFLGDANSEFYGLAWSGVAVPAPSTFALAIAIGARGASRRRRNNA